LRSLCRKAWKFESSRPHHLPREFNKIGRLTATDDSARLSP
jgi:hypothetical protein